MIRFLQTPTTTKKIVLGGLLIFIAGMMVLTLIPGIYDSLTGTSAAGGGVYANVGDQEITVAEIQQQASNYARQRGMPQLASFFASQVANDMVANSAMLAEAKRLGITASDEELRAELKTGQYGAVFFPNGQFVGEDQYLAILQANNPGMTIDKFQGLVRDSIIQRKLIYLVTGPANVSDEELKSAFMKQNQKVKFDYAVLTTADLMKQVTVTDSELKNYYDQHKQEYVNSIPEKRKLRFVAVDAAKIAPPITQADLQDYYNNHRNDFKVPECVAASHILIAPTKKDDAQADAAAKAKAEDVLKQLKGGADFAELAKKYSDDPGSKEQGGSLGCFQKTAMVSEFADAAFAMNKKGQLSDPVKTVFGYHIIRFDHKEPEHTKTFDEVKADIQQSAEAEKKTQAIQQQSQKLLDVAKRDGLDKAAAAAGSQVVTTDYVTAGDALPGIGQSPQFSQQVFQAPPKSGLELAKTTNGFAIFEVLDVKAAATPTFEEIRSKVEQQLRNQKAGALLSTKTEELSEKAKSYHDLKKAAKELGATVRTSELVDATKQVPELGSMSGPASVAFSLEPGQISGPVQTGQNGAVIQLTDKQAPSADEFAKQKDAARDQLIARKRSELLNVYQDSLIARMKKEGKIKYNKDEQQRINNGGLTAGM